MLVGGVLRGNPRNEGGYMTAREFGAVGGCRLWRGYIFDIVHKYMPSAILHPPHLLPRVRHPTSMMLLGVGRRTQKPKIPRKGRRFGLRVWLGGGLRSGLGGEGGGNLALRPGFRLGLRLGLLLGKGLTLGG